MPHLGHVLFICPVIHTPHSILSSHVEPCPTQELQAQSCSLSACCRVCFLSLSTAIVSYPHLLLSFCTPPFSLVYDFSCSHGSLPLIHQANSKSQPWQYPQNELPHKNFQVSFQSVLNSCWLQPPSSNPCADKTIFNPLTPFLASLHS